MALLTREQFEVVLSDIVERLRSAVSPVAIYLYGSYAYGTPDRHSDIDLLVVVEDSPLSLSPYKRDAAAHRALGDIPVPIDVLVYTSVEFEERAALPVSFERTVKRKGKLIHVA